MSKENDINEDKIGTITFEFHEEELDTDRISTVANELEEEEVLLCDILEFVLVESCSEDRLQSVAAHFVIRVFKSISSWVTWDRPNSLLRVPFCRLLFCYFRQLSCAILTIVLTVLLCVLQLSASLKSSRGDIGGIFWLLPMSNIISRGAVMIPSSMTVNVINFDGHFTDMIFDIYEMSLSDNGTLTLLPTRFRTQRGERLRVKYTEVDHDHDLSDNQGISCVAADFWHLSYFYFPWTDVA